MLADPNTGGECCEVQWALRQRGLDHCLVCFVHSPAKKIKRSTKKHGVDTMDSAVGNRRSYDPRKDSLVQKIKAPASSWSESGDLIGVAFGTNEELGRFVESCGVQFLRP